MEGIVWTIQVITELGELCMSYFHQTIVLLFADVDGYNNYLRYTLVKYSKAIGDNLLVYMDNIAFK